jgi:hypothetical protein
LHQGLVAAVVIQQFFYVGIALAAATTNAQTFEQFTLRPQALVNGLLNLGIRYCLANAYVHEVFPK